MTLKNDKGRETTLEVKDTRSIKVGDTVKIQEGNVIKVGALPEPIPYPEYTIGRIEGNKVTLLTVVEVKDPRAIKVGDRVKIQDGKVIKVGALPNTIPRPSANK